MTDKTESERQWSVGEEHVTRGIMIVNLNLLWSEFVVILGVMNNIFHRGLLFVKTGLLFSLSEESWASRSTITIKVYRAFFKVFIKKI